MTKVSSANFGSKQHCPHTTQLTTVQEAAEGIPDLKRLASHGSTWEKARMFHVDLLSHCVAHTLCPDNSTMLGKQQHRTKSTRHWCHVTLTSWSFASIVIANGVLLRNKFRRSQKIVMYQLPRCALEPTKEYSPVNPAQYCGKLISILLIVHELEWREKEKN